MRVSTTGLFIGAAVLAFAVATFFSVELQTVSTGPEPGTTIPELSSTIVPTTSTTVAPTTTSVLPTTTLPPIVVPVVPEAPPVFVEPAPEPLPVPEVPVVQPAGDIESLICQTFVNDCAKALSVAWCESNHNPNVVGGAGERGLFQIHPVHIPNLSSYGGWDAMFDPSANIAYAFDLYSRSGWGPWTCA